MQRIVKFEIVNYGWDHAQYFQGDGVAHTEFEEMAMGVGENAREAYDDAVEQLAIMDWDVERLPTWPHDIRKSDKVPASAQADEHSELNYYVGIKVRGLQT